MRVLYAFKSENNHYICAEGGGGGALKCDRTEIGAWESFELISSGDNVSFRTSLDSYICADQGGGHSLVTADRWAVDAWEKFILVQQGTRNGNPAYAIQTWNGHYLSAQGGGGGAMGATPTAVGAWEIFERVPVRPARIALRSCRKYVQMQNGGSVPQANSGRALGWETFKAIWQGNDVVILQAIANGKYLCVEANGDVRATAGTIDDSCKFTYADAGNGQFSLRASNGQYVSSMEGNYPLNATKSGVFGDWEKFDFVDEVLVAFFRGYGDDEDIYGSQFNSGTWWWSAPYRLLDGAQTRSTPVVATSRGRTLCVHRGAADRDLWWFENNKNSTWWGGVQRFSNGNQSDSAPALIQFHGKLYCVHCGSGDRGLWFSTFDFNSNTWSGDTRFSQGNLAQEGVGLAVFQNKLYCAHRGQPPSGNAIGNTATDTGDQPGDERLYWCTFDETTGNWTADQHISGNESARAPCLVVFKGSLYCIYRGSGSNRQIHWCKFNPATQTWGDDEALGVGTSAWAVSALEYLGTIFLAYRAPGYGPLHWNTFDPGPKALGSEWNLGEPQLQSYDAPFLALVPL